MDSTTGTHGSNKFTDDSLTIGDLCTADDRIYAIIPSKLSKPSIELPPNLVVLCQESLTEPLLHKIAHLDSTIETLEKERNEHAMEKLVQDKQMEQIMTRVKGMIDESTQSERLKAEKRLEEERAKADEKLACELAKADEKLAGELAKANKRIDELQSKLRSSNDRADEMSFKLQEVDAVTMETAEWISLGVRPGSNQHLPELTLTGHSLTGSNQAAKPAQHRTGKTCFILPTYKHARRCFTCLARSIGIHRRFRYQTCHCP